MATLSPPGPVAPERAATTAPERVRAPYTRLTALGLVLVALAPAIMITAAAAAGLPIMEDLVFFGPPIAVPLVAAALVWRFGTWARIVGVVAAMGAAFLLFWVVFHLVYPASIADFMPAVLMPVGLLLVLGAGIGGIAQKRRGRTEADTANTERRVGTGVLGVVAVALVVSIGLMLTSRDIAQGTVTATLANFTFVEGTYEVTAGEPVELVVHNTDPFTHTFTAPELGINEVILPGNRTAVELTAAEGTYTIYCEPHSEHDEANPDDATGMTATIVASGAGSASPATSGATSSAPTSRDLPPLEAAD